MTEVAYSYPMIIGSYVKLGHTVMAILVSNQHKNTKLVEIHYRNIHAVLGLKCSAVMRYTEVYDIFIIGSYMSNNALGLQAS